ncbi:MAG TPA: S53 family peptidase [Candidatus Dormibacteraeota bacterium]|nr:S53 family peptidase [Candidatus Dormibacteraeota bacterium]
MKLRRYLTVTAAGIPAVLATASLAGTAAVSGPTLVPMAIQAPDTQAAPAGGGTPACTSPAPVHTYASYHCYTPSDIAAAYGISAVHSGDNLGQGQTIVLVDSYGSPTAAHDLKFFHDTFYSSLPNPNFNEVYPQGVPDYNNTNSNGLSGPSSAANWSGEATLDIEWSYAIAPEAHIVLLAVPPAETEGVQGFPNLFKAIEWAIGNYPAGTIFSQSFGVTEQTFGGAAQTQTAGFDKVYKDAAAKGDTVFASSGDSGSTGVDKQHKDGRTYPFPTDGWPASSPWVTAAGGTQLQYGWTWAPTAPGDLSWTPGGNSETVWNEPYLPAASGGGPSSIYGKQSWQSAQASVIGSSVRGEPDVAWNAAVNGGVLVYITAFPAYQRSGWHVYGGTSAASPQLAGVIALADTALAAAKPGHHVGYLNPKLYAIGDAAGSSTSTFTGTGDFRDIVPQTYGVYTLRNNTLGANPDGSTPTGGVHGYPTLNGWDMTTGFGTPRVSQLIADLVAAS